MRPSFLIPLVLLAAPLAHIGHAEEERMSLPVAAEAPKGDSKALANDPVVSPFEPVYKRLITEGAKPEFVQALRMDPAIVLHKKFVSKNVMNFMLEDNYKQFLSKKSVGLCKKFLRLNAKWLNRCEKRFGVSKEVVTALLFVETKHGRDTGRSHVPNVFMNLARSDIPEVLSEALEQAKEDGPKEEVEAKKLQEKVRASATRKAGWAIEQLMALEKMRDRGINIATLKGSFSGAFGLSQFIPSSYLSWGVDGNGDGKVNLFEPADAICSVGNYLKSNGWGKTLEARKKAIFHYNRSTEYGQTILKLAQKLRKRSSRRIASEPPPGEGESESESSPE